MAFYNNEGKVRIKREYDLMKFFLSGTNTHSVAQPSCHVTNLCRGNHSAGSFPNEAEVINKQILLCIYNNECNIKKRTQQNS